MSIVILIVVFRFSSKMSQWTLVEATAATAVAVGAIAIDSVLDSYGRVVPLVDPQMQTRVLPVLILFTDCCAHMSCISGWLTCQQISER